MNPILARLDEERRTLAYDGDTLERLPTVTRLTNGTFHTVISSTLTNQTADVTIANEIAHHRAKNVPFEWKLFAHDQPADLRARLERQGFTIGRHEAVLICPLTPPPAWIDEPTTKDIRPLTHPDQLAHYDLVQRQAFGHPNDHVLASLAEALNNNSTTHTAYIAYDNDRPVATGRLYTHPHSHFAGLYGGATLPTHRHQGFYRALTATRAKAARAAGARYLQVDALPTSRPILERLGFLHLTDTWPCEWSPESPAPQ